MPNGTEKSAAENKSRRGGLARQSLPAQRFRQALCEKFNKNEARISCCDVGLF
jgi:hypothetical protein